LITFSEVKELSTTYNTINVERYDEISSYHDIRDQLNRLSRKFQSFLTQPEYLVPFLQPGRLVKVCIFLQFNIRTDHLRWDFCGIYLLHIIIIVGEKRKRNVRLGHHSEF